MKDTHTCDECGQVLDGHNSRFDPEYGGTCDNCIEMKIEDEYEDLIYDERGDDEDDGCSCGGEIKPTNITGDLECEICDKSY